MTVDRLKRAMPFIITGIAVATLLVIQFTVIGTNDEFDLQAVAINTAINAAIIVAMAVTWQLSGSERAKSDAAYHANLREYAQKIDEVNAGKLDKLSAFCATKTEEQVAALRKRYLSQHCVDYDKYQNSYIGKTKGQLIELKLNDEQVKAVLAAQRRYFRVRPINPVELMTDSKSRNEYDIHYNAALDRSARLALRVAKSVVTGGVLSILAVDLAQNIGDIEAWALFGMKLLTIVFTAWSAYNEGFAMIADTKKEVLKKRIMFLNLFLTQCKCSHEPLAKTE